MNSNERRAYFKQFDRKRAAHLVWARAQFRRAFRTQFREWLKLDVLDSDLLDPEPMERAYRIVWSKVGQDFAVSTAQTIETGRKSITATRNDYRASLLSYLATNGAERVTGVNQTTKDKLRAILNNAVNQGLSIAETNRLIRSEYNVMTNYRAERIARTEIIGASNRGAYEAGRATGIQLNKIWIATVDDRTRDSHRELDGTSIEQSELFRVGSEWMETPGDVTASPENFINCRCTIAFEQPKNEPF